MILFLHHRCGSQAVLDCLMKDRVQIEGEIFSNPPIPYRHFIYGTDSIQTIQTRPSIFWWIYIGHWWGDIAGKDVPGPILAETSNHWRFEELVKLPPMPMATLIRSGPNQIESMRWIKDGYEEKRRIADPVDWFVFLCKAWRNRAQWCLDIKEKFDGFKIFKFEDLTRDPTTFMQQLFEFYGLEMSNRARQVVKEKFAQHQIKESTFPGDVRFNDRSEKWSDDERSIFKETCDAQMKGLGY